jgi:hypothetical protein
MFELPEVAVLDMAPDGATQGRVPHVQYSSDDAWPFGNPTAGPMIPLSEEEAYPVDDNVAFVCRLFHEMLRLGPHAI